MTHASFVIIQKEVLRTQGPEMLPALDLIKIIATKIIIRKSFPKILKIFKEITFFNLVGREHL